MALISLSIALSMPFKLSGLGIRSLIEGLKKEFTYSLFIFLIEISFATISSKE